MLTQDGLSPKVYGAVIGGALIWLVQALLHLDANSVNIVDIAGQHVTLAGLLTAAGTAAGAYLARHKGVLAVPPADDQIDVSAGNPEIPPAVLSEAVDADRQPAKKKPTTRRKTT